jgi:hypothetical protein
MSQAHTYSTLIWGSRGGTTWSHNILLHVQMSTLKWQNFWDYQSRFWKLNWNTLILRVSKPPNPLFGLNIWHQYFMDLNENFSRSCHDWTWFVFPNYILNGWKSFWQFMWQPLKSFLLLKKHLYFLWLYEFTSYMSHWDFFLTIPSMFSSLKPQSMVPNWKTCQENMFSKFGIFSWPYQTCFHPSNLSLIMFKWK